MCVQDSKLESKSSATASASASAASGDAQFSARHLQSFSRVGAPVPSPSGRHIVFSVKSLRSSASDDWYHEDTNRDFTTQLWIVDCSPAVYNTKTLHAAGSGGAATDTKSSPSALAPYDGHVRRLTSPPEKKSDFEPVWLDDSTIAFLSTRSGSSQIWFIPINGGEAQQLTSYPVGVEHLRYNSVRSFVAFAAEVYPDLSPALSVPATGSGSSTVAAAMTDSAKRDDERKKRAANVMKFDHLFFRRWDKFVESNGKRLHLFIHSIHKTHSGGWTLSGSPIDIMAGRDADSPIPPFGDASQYAISPFGDEIAYATHSLTTSEVAWSTAVRIYTIKIDAQRAAQLPAPTDSKLAAVAAANAKLRPAVLSVSGTATPTNISAFGSSGNDHAPLYSPDGKYLLYLSMVHHHITSPHHLLLPVLSLTCCCAVLCCVL